jgi:hypothetical protein
MVNQLDPSQWFLKGEGQANYVFDYRGDSPLFRSRVLRVRKLRDEPPPSDAVTRLEAAIWADLDSIHPACGAPISLVSSEQIEHSDGNPMSRWELAYVDRVLRPLIGREHVARPEPAIGAAPAILSFLRALERTAGPMAAIDMARIAAQFMPDATIFGAADAESPLLESAKPAGPSACVEIKPKWGFASGCECVRLEDRAIKRSRSRFQLYQVLKAAKGLTQRPSSYDPRDLFSGDDHRGKAALHALLDSPVGSVMTFIDGRPSSAAALADGTAEAAAAAALVGRAEVEGSPAAAFGSQGRRELLVELVWAALRQEGGQFSSSSSSSVACKMKIDTNHRSLQWSNWYSIVSMTFTTCRCPGPDTFHTTAVRVRHRRNIPLVQKDDPASSSTRWSSCGYRPRCRER